MLRCQAYNPIPTKFIYKLCKKEIEGVWSNKKRIDFEFNRLVAKHKQEMKRLKDQHMETIKGLEMKFSNDHSGEILKWVTVTKSRDG